MEPAIINFEKSKMTWGIVKDIMKYQQSKYDFEPVPVVQNFLQNVPAFTEATLHKLSLECEPVEA